MNEKNEKINYQKKLEEIIARHQHYDSRPHLLMHSCCAPCSSYVMEYLNQFFDLTLYFYNPNIFPATEYYLRVNEQKQLIKAMGLTAAIKLIETSHDADEFTLITQGLETEKEGGARCAQCFHLRLDKAAQYAKKNGFDYFSTTLTISPMKNAEIINRIGEEIQTRYNIDFLPTDFKKKGGYQRSIALSKEHGLYRQDYCGCRWSIREV